MSRSSRATVVLLLGLLMIAIGAYVAVRLAGGARPLTSSALLDGVFAAFFALRGALNVRTARRVSRADAVRAGEPPRLDDR